MSEDNAVQQRLLSPNEAAHYLGISRRMLYALMAKKGLPFIKIGNRRRRLDLNDLDTFIEANKHPPSPTD